MFNKKDLSEEDIKMKYITPALEQSNWSVRNDIRAEYYFTDGRIDIRGNKAHRRRGKKADYLLFYKANLPIAIIEAKDNKHSVGDGMQQGIEYAQILDVPFVYSSNGDGFLEHDMLTGVERELKLDEFPTKEELWKRYTSGKDIDKEQEELIVEPYYTTKNSKTPRYYQAIAINRTIEAIAKGQKRILLVMATGTGKTYTAFQIIHRLWKSKKVKKVLFLADRNILVDQTRNNDFQPFEKVMTKIENRKMDSSYEIYLSLYQQLTGQDSLEIFKEFSPDFFDLIIIDECHRGSAKEESRWRDILTYFDSTTQIGLTATPKETKDISSTYYFGEPVYTYSLKQGINDGFLAPFKVIRVGLDKDLEGYRPEKGKIDVNGNEIEDREYNIKDFDRNLIIDDRTKKVAQRITEFLKKTDRFSKTIVFCVNIDHAERMRQALSNENADLVAENSNYVMRITGDNEIGKVQLDNFIDEESEYPTIVTTSKLMTTGVDCKTCKLIVLDSNIGSMTEFKQIIGRGTRLRPDYGKEYFTIMDFRNNSRKFADPEWDGEPTQVYEVDDNNGDNIILQDDEENNDENKVNIAGENTEGNRFGFSDDDKVKKFIVNDVPVKVLNERIQYYDEDGSLVTESVRDYTRKNILNEFANLDVFLNKWNEEKKKSAIIEELKDNGVLLDVIKEELKDKNLDYFDLICHIAYDKEPLSKSDRVNNVKKKGYLYQYSEQAQKILDRLLDKYMNEEILDLTDTRILELEDFREFGSIFNMIDSFGSKKKYIDAVVGLQNQLYMNL